MFIARCAKPECRKVLVMRRHASPSATSAGTSAPRVTTFPGCCTRATLNGVPSSTPTAATARYTRAQAVMRPKVIGRREKVKVWRRARDPVLAAFDLADGVANLDLGYVFKGAAEHTFEIRIIVGAVPGAKAPNLNVLAEHLPQHALEILLKLTETRKICGPRGRAGIEDAGDGELLLDLGDLGLGLHILYGS